MSILHCRFALIRRYVLGVLLLVPLLFAPGAPSQAATVFFADFTDVAAQVNEGPVFNPASAPNLTITARGNIDPTKDDDPFAPSSDPISSTNTIVLSPAGGAKPTRKGLGVQEPNGSSGSTGISGKGHEENEEAIFTFTNAVTVPSIVLGLSDICFSSLLCGGKMQPKLDDPILFLLDDQNNFEIYDSAAIAGIFAFMNDDPSTLMGTFAFADLGSGFSTITSFILRESDEEIYVASVHVVPLPAALPVFGSALAMLGIVGWRRRRQAGA